MEKFGTGNTLFERLHDDPQSDLINKLAKGFVVFPPSPVAASRAAKAKEGLVPDDALPLLDRYIASPFNSIPTELVTMIFEQMESFIDAFMFGLTSSFVWECGESRIHELYVRWFTPWAGEPLICLGGDLRAKPESRSADGPIAEITGALRAARIGHKVPELNVKELEDGLSLGKLKTGRRVLLIQCLSSIYPLSALGRVSFQIQRPQYEGEGRATYRVHHKPLEQGGYPCCRNRLVFGRADSRCRHHLRSTPMDAIDDRQ